MSDSQNIDLRSSISRLSIWNEYPSISNMSLWELRNSTEFFQCSLSTQKRVHSAHLNHEIRMRIFCLFPSCMSFVSSSNSERLSIAMRIEYLIQASKNLLFFGPFAVIFSLSYHDASALMSSPYDDISTRHHIFFHVLRIVGDVFTFITVWIWDGNRYCESICWNQEIFLSRFLGITTPIHSISQLSMQSICLGMISFVIFMGIEIHDLSDLIGLREGILYSRVRYISYGDHRDHRAFLCDWFRYFVVKKARLRKI